MMTIQRRPCPDPECDWHDPVLVYPEEMPTWLADVLSENVKPPFVMETAETFRKCGVRVNERIQDEYAFVRHWLIKLALRHGRNWQARMHAELKEMNDKIKAREVVSRLAPEAAQ